MNMRLATEEDLASIVSIFLSCWKESYADVLSAEVREAMDAERAEQLWNKSFFDETLRTYISYEDKNPTAVFRYGAARDEAGAGHLYSLYVDPRFSGRGVGRSIMEEVISLARSDAFERITLWVFESNLPARALYKKFGFEPTGRSRMTPEWGALEIELSATLI